MGGRYTIGDMPSHEHSGEYPTRVAETGVISARPFLADNGWHVEHIFRDGRLVDFNTVPDRAPKLAGPAIGVRGGGQIAGVGSFHVNPYATKSGENHG